MNLFRQGNFTLSGGSKSKWKIDCDALTEEDWNTLAAMAVEILPPFNAVIGIMRGGVPFANALKEHCKPEGRVLIADDVLTSGASMEKMRAGFDNPIGIVVFARHSPLPWIHHLFRFGY